MKACTDSIYMPQFYKEFLASDIYVVRQGEVKENNFQSQVIKYNNQLYIPIFSSILRLQTIIKSETNYVSLNALVFLKSINAELILNPGSDYGKIFTSPEILFLIKGEISKGEHFTISKDTIIILGKPLNYPKEVLDTLIRFFRIRKEVNKEYLAQIYIPDRNEKPHLVIGLVVTKDWENIVNEAFLVIKDLVIPNSPLDFIEVHDESIFQDLKPFYKKEKYIEYSCKLFKKIEL